jgi:hypothetical protein
MSVVPLVVVPPLGAAFAYASVAYAAGSVARTKEQRALVKKQARWTAVIVFFGLIMVGVFVLP